MRIIVSIFACLISIIAVAAPEIGEPAPEFCLQDQDKKWHSLDEYSGKWVVLYFYPKDDTPGCTTEACAFRDDIFAFRKLGVTILGVSLDDVESHIEFSEKYSLPFPLLSDADAQVSKAYGVYRNRGIMKYAKRETFVVDPNGVIARYYPDVEPDKHSQELQTDLAALIDSES